MKNGIYRVTVEDNDVDLSPTIETVLEDYFTGTGSVTAELLMFEK